MTKVTELTKNDETPGARDVLYLVDRSNTNNGGNPLGFQSPAEIWKIAEAVASMLGLHGEFGRVVQEPATYERIRKTTIENRPPRYTPEYAGYIHNDPTTDDIYMGVHDPTNGQQRWIRLLTDIWKPTQLSTLTGWFEAGDLSTITQGSPRGANNRVDQWRAKNDATLFFEADAGEDPVLVATDDPVNISFTGSGDDLNVSTTLRPVILDAHYIGIVVRVDSTSGAMDLFEAENAANNADVFGVRFNVTNGGDIQYSVGSGTATTAADAFTASQFHFLMVTYDGSSDIEIFLDGVSVATATDATQIADVGGFRFGRDADFDGAWFGGDVQDQVWGSGAITTAQRQQLEGYHMHRAGIAANLPSNHPYLNAPPTII